MVKIINIIKEKRGNVILTAVIILSAFTLTISTGVALTSIDSRNVATDYLDGDSARLLADSCSHDTLAHLTRDINYTGGIYALSGGECNVNITSSGLNTLVQISATRGKYVSEISHIVNTNVRPYTILKWKRGF